MSINYPTLVHFRHFSSLFTHFPSTTVENIRQINPFYAKQTQFQKCNKNINTFLTMRYENLGTLMGQKTKPKQTQLKPIQTQFKANKAKNKPNSNPNKANPNHLTHSDFLAKVGGVMLATTAATASGLGGQSTIAQRHKWCFFYFVTTAILVFDFELFIDGLFLPPSLCRFNFLKLIRENMRYREPSGLPLMLTFANREEDFNASFDWSTNPMKLSTDRAIEIWRRLKRLEFSC